MNNKKWKNEFVTRWISYASYTRNYIGVRLLYLYDYTVYMYLLYYVHVQFNDLGGTRNIHVVDCVITERLCV